MILKAHVKNKHKNEKEKETHVCKICKEEVDDWNVAIKHTEDKHFQTWNTKTGQQIISKFYVCVECEKRTDTEQQMMEHWGEAHTKKEIKEDIKKELEEKSFKCNECERHFKTKQGMNLHVTMKHRRAEEKAKKGKNLKRQRSVKQKQERYNCKHCDIKCKTQPALNTHMNHDHKDSASPEHKKLKSDTVVADILSEVVDMVVEEPTNKTTIEPSQEFLTYTAKTLSQMLDDAAENIDDDEDEDLEDEISFTDLNERLNVLRGDAKERKKNSMQDFLEEDAMVTLPLKDVEELRIKLQEASTKLKKVESENAFLKEQIKETKYDNKGDNLKEKKQQESTFQCDNCGKKFLKRDNLLGHIMNHGKPTKSGAKSGGQVKPVEEVEPMEFTQPFQPEEVWWLQPQFQCDQCHKMFTHNNTLLQHKNTEHKTASPEPAVKEPSFNCNKCQFQGNSEDNLKNHIKTTKHQDSFKCNDCEEVFTEFPDLMVHRKAKHTKKCKNLPRCTRGDSCWYSHPEHNTSVETDEATTTIVETQNECKVCHKKFESKHVLMKHRKSDHATTVSICREFLHSSCSRGDDRCWYRHQTNKQPSPQEEQLQSRVTPRQVVPQINSTVDFPQAHQLKEPPSNMNNQQPSDQITILTNMVHKMQENQLKMQEKMEQFFKV